MTFTLEKSYMPPADLSAPPRVQTTVILNTRCSTGRLTITEYEVATGAASPRYYSPAEECVAFITEGKFIISVNGEEHVAEKGDDVFIPCGNPYYFYNAGTSTGKLLLTSTEKHQPDYVMSW